MVIAEGFYTGITQLLHSYYTHTTHILHTHYTHTTHTCTYQVKISHHATCDSTPEVVEITWNDGIISQIINVQLKVSVNPQIQLYVYKLLGL